MRYFILLLIWPLYCSSQNSTAIVNYAGKKIKLLHPYDIMPDGIENDKNSIKWQYFTDKMIASGEPEALLEQTKINLKAIQAQARPIVFVSQGDTIKGVKYSYMRKRQKQYNIVGYGRVNGKPVLLIYHSFFDPNSNDKLDSTMKNFIKL